MSNDILTYGLSNAYGKIGRGASTAIISMVVEMSDVELIRGGVCFPRQATAERKKFKATYQKYIQLRVSIQFSNH